MRAIGWLFLLVLTNSAIGADRVPVHEFRLDNGLKLIVKEDHRAPVVVSQVWYKVGSSYEHDGVTGLSHVLEHMMFKGTKKYPAGEFSRIIAENGGSENAFTGRDYTAYYQQLEKSRLEVSFRMESDRMRNLLLKDDEVVKETNVVKEERRLRTDDQPKALTYEQFTSVAYLSSPYRIPVIGWMDDLDHLQIDDLRNWYQQWYAPNNAVLVVVGDVDPDAVLKLAKKYFGPLKPSKITPVKPRAEIEQKGERRITVKVPAELPYLMVGYKVPTLTTATADWEPYALDVLAAILDGGSSARFSKNLVRGTEVAANAGAGYSLDDRLQSLFLIDGTPAHGHTIAELEKGVYQQLDDLKTTLVSADELDRIKVQVVANEIYEQDSIFFQAMQIGTMETVGLDWRLLDQQVERIRAVTPEQVRDVARRYLVDTQRTVAILDPLPLNSLKPPAPPASLSSGGHRH
ncbi:MAG: peptidase M16 domain-containing protein [Gammaproteobacteria bacterium]|nr:MAG: peptidase M16 domain-containing protein [Gammaproteobacteria bacterium]TND02992.1 MAG: peptidase M16 domain-containing protein [Gammaproteobacteria bacterium]